MFKEAESRPDKIESTSNNVQVRKKQQYRRRACDLLVTSRSGKITSVNRTQLGTDYDSLRQIEHVQNQFKFTQTKLI